MTKVTIGAHLLNRLKEINIDTIFGAPGDYNLPLIDLIEDDKDLTWGNNANELNAAYAADGYARIKGTGAIVTTFGVGELSALNGIAGSYAEMIPIIHIVGIPKTISQQQKDIMHHSLGDGDFNVFSRMSTCITVASVSVSANNAVKEIDRVIKTACLYKRPVYIAIPMDLIKMEIDAPDTLLKPLDLSYPPNTKKSQEHVLSQITRLIKNAKRPTVVIDACVLRYRLDKEANEFVKRSGFPTFTAPMGKGAIDESLHNFRGCYSGKTTMVGIIKEIEQADLLIEMGSIKADSNTGDFTYGLEDKTTISLHSISTIINGIEYPGVKMMELLPLLTARLPENPPQICFPERTRPALIDQSVQEITHNYLWNRVSEFVEPGSIIVAETGSAQHGIFNIDGIKETKFITQLLWGSTGYTVGATLGAAIAARQQRVYLFIGDASYQFSCQEVSLMLRHGVTPVIFVLNNDGYAMEKPTYGCYHSYNNAQTWNYSKSLDFFGGHLDNNKNRGDGRRSEVGFEGKVVNRQEFEKALSVVSQQPHKIHFIEVVMPQFDVPYQLLLDPLVNANQVVSDPVSYNN